MNQGKSNHNHAKGKRGSKKKKKYRYKHPTDKTYKHAPSGMSPFMADLSTTILVVTTHSSAPVVSCTERINNIDSLANTSGAFSLPPLLPLLCKG